MRAISQPTSRRWADRIAPLRDTCRDIFVYFKHEEQGKGTAFAREFLTRLGMPVIE